MFTVRKGSGVRVMFRMDLDTAGTNTLAVPQELLPIMGMIVEGTNGRDPNVLRRLEYVKTNIDALMQLSERTMIKGISVMARLKSANTPGNSGYSLTPELKEIIRGFLKIVFPPKA